jgi:hypothetical protein
MTSSRAIVSSGRLPSTREKGQGQGHALQLQVGRDFRCELRLPPTELLRLSGLGVEGRLTLVGFNVLGAG